ncbi:hypothetical protein HanXRQr2_Chr03g0114891 [Helianthus annuus]|uniref:Uncharacterized protein n=1 Tax=Helianthus annuus TaxID=4232 RepID=A0A9K3NW96_HELAN|nr:hypothetical protein HanXRQr2_Chr03g0114891 [Helianthus annuus]KAJ0944008.1 hypothetical protein HanPSC8_Chr03g0111261 [Helianthus annuus]
MYVTEGDTTSLWHIAKAIHKLEVLNHYVHFRIKGFSNFSLS